MRQAVSLNQEKREVRTGSGRECLPTPMTKAQALRYGNRSMPGDLKRAGFQTSVFTSDTEINGGHFFRVNYGKTVGGLATTGVQL